MKKLNKKGFTLAELLIVVAIIAILIAIAIPVFTKQLEKSRDATSAANIRSAYAEATVDLIDLDDVGVEGASAKYVTLMSGATKGVVGASPAVKWYDCKVMSSDKLLEGFEDELPVAATDGQEIVTPDATKIAFIVENVDNKGYAIVGWVFDNDTGIDSKLEATYTSDSTTALDTIKGVMYPKDAAAAGSGD